ncbi:hypothetical protein J6590_081461 [Homalodisca vitripennis]|nr:hypothetical protein J6590_081461 [Homalodisca vitripennis]
MVQQQLIRQGAGPSAFAKGMDDHYVCVIHKRRSDCRSKSFRNNLRLLEESPNGQFQSQFLPVTTDTAVGPVEG